MALSCRGGIEARPSRARLQTYLFQPQPGGGLTQVQATLDSPYGLVKLRVGIDRPDFRLNVTVPTNSYATIRLPATALDQVQESGQPIINGQRTGWLLLFKSNLAAMNLSRYGINLAQVMTQVRHVAGRLDRYSSLGDWLANEQAKAALIAQSARNFCRPRCWAL